MPENTDPNATPSNPEDLGQNVPESAPSANPEMASVAMNQAPKVPQTPQAPVPPTPNPVPPVQAKVPASPAGPKRIGKEKNVKSRTRFLLGCAGSFIVLFVLFIVLMVLMISRSGASNSVMQAFGLDPGGMRNFLQMVVGFSFGMLALLFLVLLVIAIFKFFGAQKSDKDKRNHQLRMTLVDSLSLFFLVFIWILLAGYIGRIEISAERVIAEIVVVEPEDVSSLSAPVEITFSALNVALGLQQAGVAIESMHWDLDGDGLYETLVNDPEVVHLYNQRGTYNVGLEVKLAGEEALTEIYKKTIVIEDAVFGASPSAGTAPQLVQFDAGIITSRDNAASLDWDFDGDGQFDIEGPDNFRPRHTFDKIGTYKVHLRVIDKNNNVENYYRNIEITTSEDPILSAKIDATPGLTGSIPLQVRFDAERSNSLKGTITKYQWDFGDGSDLQSGKSTSHIFDEAGFYTVKLTVTDNLENESESTVTVEVTSVSSIPEAVIDTVPSWDNPGPLTGVLPFKVEFDASNSLDADDDIVEYEWDFNNDGVVDQEGKRVSYTFEEAGTFITLLSVKDSEGQAGTVFKEIKVDEPGVQAVISATPEEGTAPLVVQFDGSSSSSYKGNIVSYEWDFGDGSPKTITGAIVSHKYNEVGTYEARLKVPYQSK